MCNGDHDISCHKYTIPNSKLGNISHIEKSECGHSTAHKVLLIQIYCDVYAFLVRIITCSFKTFDVTYSLCV